MCGSAGTAPLPPILRYFSGSGSLPRPPAAAEIAAPSARHFSATASAHSRSIACFSKVAMGGARFSTWHGDRADNEGFQPSPLPPVCRARLPARYSLPERIVLCPSRSWTVRRSTPDITSRLAKVCLRQCQVKSSMRAILRALLKTRFM